MPSVGRGQQRTHGLFSPAWAQESLVSADRGALRELRYREPHEALADARSKAEHGSSPALLKVYEGAILKVCELWDPLARRWQQADPGGQPREDPAISDLPLFTIKAGQSR